MKKHIILYFVFFFLGVSFTVSASYIYNAKDIKLSSIKTEKTNVQEAIDELYDDYLKNSADLIWKNSDYTKDFPAQKLNLNLSNYEYIVIVACYSKNNCTSHTKSLLKVGTSDKYISGNNINYACTFRNVDIDESGINFSLGYTYVNNSDTTYNYIAIPHYIYGIKHLDV